MHACIHTYIYACIHTYMHACMHACIHTYIHTYIMFITCTNTCFNLHIIFIRFVHGVSYLLHRILQGNVGETRFISI